MTVLPGHQDAGRSAEAGTVAGDLALAADVSVIERAADPGEFVIQACQRARAWLREALDHGDIGQIAELKSRAEAVLTTRRRSASGLRRGRAVRWSLPGRARRGGPGRQGRGAAAPWPAA